MIRTRGRRGHRGLLGGSSAFLEIHIFKDIVLHFLLEEKLLKE